MTILPRFAPALCTVLALSLAPGSLRAEGDLPTGIDGVSVPSLVTWRAQDDEVVASLNVSVPRNTGTLETSAALLFLQPGTGNPMYGTLINPFPFISPHWRNQSVRPDFTPAFNVGLRYLLDYGAISVDWTHLNSDDYASVGVLQPIALGQTSGPPTIQALGPPYLIGPPVPYAFASAVAHFNYEAVNLQGEVSLNLGSRVQLRSFAGLQVTRINERLTARFSSLDESLGLIYVTRSSFTGAGPRLGLELRTITGGLDLLGGIAGATIIGARQSQLDLFAKSPDNTAGNLTPNVQFLASPAVTQVIPCIEGKLAASYSLPLGSFGILRCEAGYQTAVYINVLNQFSLTEVEDALTATTPGAPETTGSAVFLRTAFEAQTNFLVHGPYLKLSLEF